MLIPWLNAVYTRVLGGFLHSLMFLTCQYSRHEILKACICITFIPVLAAVAWPPKLPVLHPLNFYLLDHDKKTNNWDAMLHRVFNATEWMLNTPDVHDRITDSLSQQAIQYIMLMQKSLTFIVQLSNDFKSLTEVDKHLWQLWNKTSQSLELWIPMKIFVYQRNATINSTQIESGWLIKEKISELATTCDSSEKEWLF